MVVPMLHSSGRMQVKAVMRELTAWLVLVVCSLGSRLVYMHAWSWVWWTEAQYVLAIMCLIVGARILYVHRPRWRGLALVLFVLVVGQWHLVRSAWMLLAWSIHGYHP